MKRFNTFFLILFVANTLAFAEEARPVKPSPEDKCPVCGMFVAKYPDWVGEITFKDGTTVFFDGAKDLFKYCFNISKYSPKKSEADIAAVYVTEYYDLILINAYDAFYVIGSNVYGPMGRELIPFKAKSDAEAFMRDHQGKKVVRFQDVTSELIDAFN